ncbi:MAG TPA: T9SS type A sorting domain-containing protein, partial [Chitinophagaceae bacterium]|nr:T9SS type A sorting domain-containing protein [Chitinophagaceae bacterium]
NIDTTAAFYIDSLERGFEVGFWLKCERLVNRLSASAHKTSLLSRLSTAKTNHFGTGMKMATLNFTNATTVAGYSNMTVNANNQTVSGLLDATGTNTGWTYTRQTATSTQERTQGLGVSYYNVPASIHSTGHEFFNTGTATDIIGGLDNSKTYTIFYFGSKTASVSVDPTIVTSIGAESDTVNQQYFNTREYALFNSKSPSSGNITVTHRNLLANAITIQNFVIIIEHGSTNATPTANAGSDVSITLPTTSTTLDASSSSDSDGSITGYLWTFITGGTGTSTPSISNSTSASTGITGLTAAGTYFFRVTVTDNNGATDDDDVIVTVNPATQAIQVNVYGGTNPYNNTAWNNWNIGSGTVSNVTSSAFNYADGSASGVTATLSFSQAVADNGSSYGGTMCPPEVLRYTSYSSTNRTLTIGNLDGSATYDIEFYASRSSTGNATVFTIGGVSDTVVTGNNTTVPAVFSSVAPDGSNNIVVSLARTSGSSFHYLNGFKLTKIASGARSKRNQAAEPAGNTTGDVKLLLSPNPVAGRLKISFSSDRTGIVKLDIYDAMGRMVESRSFVKVHQQLQGNLDVAGLGKGLYYVSIEDGSGKRIVTKFLKQ